MMKKLITTLIIPLFLGIIMTGCESYEPEGSITLKMRNDDHGSNNIYFGDGYVEITSSNNFHCSGYWYSNVEMEMSAVGKVSGLNKIKKIPQAGWTNEIAVQEGYGYIVRSRKKIESESNSFSDSYSYSDYEYMRIFVIESIISTNGGIIGYEVSYIEGM